MLPIDFEGTGKCAVKFGGVSLHLEQICRHTENRSTYYS
jgi:hypothetical protein